MAQPGGRTPSKVPLECTDDGRLRFHGCSRIQDYDFLGKLGEGTFGEVSKARSKRSGAVVALKKILMHNEKDGFPITALREIKLLKQLDHINILKLEEMAVERSKDPKKKPSMFMVTPYMDHDLSGLLENPSVHFTEPQIKCYLMQLLEGCKYLHENKILHRDMKAANLLINNHGILQIADFGLARPYDDEPPKAGHGGGQATRDYTCLVVTRWYRPPELLLQLRRYTTAIDMWGVGCVFGEMFKGRPILAGNSDLNQAQQIFELVGSPNDENMPGWSELPGCDGVKEFEFRRGNLPTVFREQGSLAISLLSELLKLDWRKRVNAIDALKHPYFHSPPLPARPGDLPQFEDSHELDRRKFRGQKQALPPAPAGGSVGMGPDGQWAEDGRPLPNMQRGRGPHPYQNGHGHHHRQPPLLLRPHLRGPDGEMYRRLPSHQDAGLPLPPKPPPALDQNGGFRNNKRVPLDQQYGGGYRNDSRGPSDMDQRQDRSTGGAAYGGDRRRVPDAAKVDTYIPHYSNVPDRGPPRRDDPLPAKDEHLPRDPLSVPRDVILPPRQAYLPPGEHHYVSRDGAREDYPLSRRQDIHRREGPQYDRCRYEDGRRDAGGYDRRRSRSPRARNWDRPSTRERDAGDRYRR
jgi:serine/threonine-protein kinase BUR1